MGVTDNGPLMGYKVEADKEGRVIWTPDVVSTKLDHDAFQREIKKAGVISEEIGKPVHWYHNGILVDSDFIQFGCADPWGWLTEKSSTMAN